MGFLEGILYVLWRGFAIGVIISAPMGPVGILCVQRTLEKGRTTGFFTGVGAAVSDLFYCLLTGFGLSFIEDFLKANQNIIQVFGSIVLVFFGIYLFKSNPARTLKKPAASRSSHSRDMLQGFLFTVSNPLIIFLIIGLFARFNFLLPEISFFHYVLGFAAIFLGALTWWWIVAFFINKVRGHFNLRSMWLINRIIGCVIMVFALVGLITSVSGIISAHPAEPRYLNSSRGFAGLDPGGGGGNPLQISNPTDDTVARFLPLGSAEEFSFSLRARNLAAVSGRRAVYTDKSGRERKVSLPGWGIVAKSPDSTLRFLVSTLDDRVDAPYPVRVRVSAGFKGDETSERIITEGIGAYDEDNSFSLRVENGTFSLFGGNRKYVSLLDVADSGFYPDSIGIFLCPGARLQIDHIVLDVRSERAEATSTALSRFALPEVRNTYFSRSTDRMEGEWEIFDRSLDDSRLRPGGNYRLAVVRDGAGYALIYIDGAGKHSLRWRSGMIKGRLLPGPFPGVFDVEWIDPAGCALIGEIKAQFTAPDILTFSFVDHDSELRMRKVRRVTG